MNNVNSNLLKYFYYMLQKKKELAGFKIEIVMTGI